MDISRNNYEMYFIDYFEGNLNREEKEELMGFLSNNPDLKQEFDAFETFDVVEDQQVEYKFKENLKKQVSDLGPVNETTIDEYSIAYLENDLTEKEKTTLLEAIKKNEAFEKTFKLYQLTKLEPDMNVVFGKKRQTKHFVIQSKTVVRAVGIASAAAVLVLGVFVLNPNEATDNEQLAVNSEQVTVTSEQLSDSKDQKPVTSEQQPVSSNQLPVTNNKQPITSIQIEETNEKTKEESLKIKVAENSKQVTRNQQLATSREEVRFEKIEAQTLARIPQSKLPETKRIEKKNIKPTVLFAENNNQIQKKEKEPLRGISIPMVAKEINIWAIAEIGVKVFNRLNETNIDIERNFDSAGNVKSVSLITEERKITTPSI